MRGESMKGKSKKSTYSTTFGLDPKTLRTHFRFLDRRPNKRGWKKSHFWQKIASDTVFAGADESKAVVAIGNSSGSKFAAKVFGARIRPKSGKKFLAIPAIEARYGVSPSSLDKNELQFRRTRKGGLLAVSYTHLTLPTIA